MWILTALQIFIRYLPIIIKNIPLFFKMLGIAQELIHFLSEKSKADQKTTIAELTQGIAEARENKDVSRIEKIFVRDRIVKGP